MAVYKLGKYLALVCLGATFTFAGAWVWSRPSEMMPRAGAVMTWADQNPASTWVVLCSLVIACGLAYLRFDNAEQIYRLALRVGFASAAKLKPTDLNIEQYYRVYVQPPFFDEAVQKVRGGRHILILGRPASGKTRFAFEVAKSFRHTGWRQSLLRIAAGCRYPWILTTRADFSNWGEVEIPHFRALFRSDVLWLIDNLNEYTTALRDFSACLQRLNMQANVTILATCRSGEEFDQICSQPHMRVMLEKFENFTCADLSDAERWRLAEAVDKAAPDDEFDGTPGSIVLGLGAMRERLRKAASPQQQFMRTLFLLRELRVFEPSRDLARRAFMALDRSTKLIALDDSIRWLVQNDFLQDSGDCLRVRHDVYLTLHFSPYYGADDPGLPADLMRLGAFLELEPSPSYLVGLALCWESRKDFSKAVECLSSAAERLPDDPMVFNALGYALTRKKDFAAAEKAFNRAIQLDPSYYDARVNLAAVYLDIGDLNQAIGLMQELLKASRDSTVLNNLGNALRLKGELREAIACHQEAVRLRRNDPTALSNLGIDLAETHDFPGAIEAFRHALDFRLDFPEALNNLGWALCQVGEVEEGLAAMRKAAEVDPGYLQARINIAAFFATSGTFRALQCGTERHSH